MSDSGTGRKVYKNGQQTRQQIVLTALEMFSRQGYRGTSIREIAREVGLTQSGLRHHFASKEELLTEVIAMRDQIDNERAGRGSYSARAEGDPEVGGEPKTMFFRYESRRDLFDTWLGLLRRNKSQPGIVRLFSLLAAEASDPHHPAHEFFAARYAAVEKLLSDAIAASPTPVVREGLDPLTVARLGIAVMDGLQTQWFLNPGFDMEPVFTAFLQLIIEEPCGTPASDPPTTPQGTR